MTRAAKKRPRTTRARRRAGPAISPEKRAAYGQLKQGVKHLEKSIGEIQKGLRRAEQQIEAEARARVRALRKDARTQLALVKEKQREAVRRLKAVSAAAEGSWQEVKQSADAILSDAGATAASVVERLRRALTER
jgi:type VI protein secretion system component VasA